jgi:hypothetical protein
VAGKPFVVVPYTRRNNDIERLQSPSFSPADFASVLKDEFDALYAEAEGRRRMMSVSTHDRIGGQPAIARAVGGFIEYALKHPGVVFMRKDEIARWTLEQPDAPRE